MMISFHCRVTAFGLWTSANVGPARVFPAVDSPDCVEDVGVGRAQAATPQRRAGERAEGRTSSTIHAPSS
jgi:hypothetical protein